MPSVPESCCSMGAATVCAMVLALAPGYAVVIVTVGGEISGYWEIGRLNDAITPASVIRIAITVAKIGRSMKNREKAPMRLGLRLDQRSHPDLHEVVGDHLVAVLEARGDDR